MNYAYLIYQIKDPIKCDYAWMSWKTAKRDINLMDYDCVYTDSIDGEDPDAVLENLFEKFNINHPDDFEGHSMSVSDIVVLIDDIGGKWYYCDSFGWKDITEFLRERR